jgi:perosamine synthetase
MSTCHSLRSRPVCGFYGERKAKNRPIPYARQWIDEEDIKAVIEVLCSDWLTTGPWVEDFEQAFADFVGAKYAVAVSSGTAALHAAMYALGIGPGDEVIVPPMTFVATANAVVFQEGTPVFSDVEKDTLLLNPEIVEEKITPHTKAIIAVDYAGQPCDYDILRSLAKQHELLLVEDACHSLGARYKGKNVGSLADLTVFSFHPVKHITTGEGGMITTDNSRLAERMQKFRNHGIDSDHASRAKQGTWYYEMTDLGYNYRITDFQCALGLSQLEKMPFFLKRRREIAGLYDDAFSSWSDLKPLKNRGGTFNSYHLYVVRTKARDELFQRLRQKGIGVNVHYVPVHLHPFYRERFGTGRGICPVAEDAYNYILSLPMFPGMTLKDAERVVSALEGALR